MARIPAVRKTKPHVLCIDDNAPGLAVRRCVLEHWGYKVSTAVDGMAGFRVLENLPVDVVVLDYCMPGMNGGLVAEVIKTRWPEVRIVLLSGYHAVPKSVAEWADAFVTKGGSSRRLRTVLARLATPASTKMVTPSEAITDPSRKKSAASIGPSQRLRRRAGSK
jgi:CheY-like chemotaxis protein